MQRRGKIINENKKVIKNDFSHERVIFSWYLDATNLAHKTRSYVICFFSATFIPFFMNSKLDSICQSHHSHYSRSRLSWSGRNDPLNFFNIASCPMIQLNYQVFFCDHHPPSSSTPAMEMKSVIGQPCDVESTNKSTGFPLTDFSLTESSWSLPTCGESPGSSNLKSPGLLSTSDEKRATK